MLRSFPLRWKIGIIRMHVDMQIDAMRASRPKSAQNPGSSKSSKSKKAGSSWDFVRYDISSAQGRVWVPPMTQKEIQERAQYWDKFTVARSDLLFKEVVDSFHQKASKKTTSRSKSSDVRNRIKLYNAPPYPAGSCKTVVAGKFSNFCTVPTPPLY